LEIALKGLPSTFVPTLPVAAPRPAQAIGESYLHISNPNADAIRRHNPDQTLLFVREVCAYNAVLCPIDQPNWDLDVRFLLPAVPYPSSLGAASHHSAYYQRVSSAQAAYCSSGFG
jgi:hypothetical protein